MRRWNRLVESGPFVHGEYLHKGETDEEFT